MKQTYKDFDVCVLTKDQHEYMAKLQRLATLIQEQTRARILKDYPGYPPAQLEKDYTVKVILGRKFTKIDVGTSGKYMVDEIGNIYGIKAYGVIHRGHYYGTLDTVDQYYWGDYTAVRIAT